MRQLSYQEQHDRIDKELPAIALTISSIFGIPMIVLMIYIMADKGFFWLGFGVVTVLTAIILICLVGTIELFISRRKEEKE
jgi:peptidoglycan/LPS O-acetylase OafA/YrhL